MAAPDETELWDLENLAHARRLGDWTFEQFADLAHGRVAEIGAGIGTFSARVLDNGVRDALLIEPDEACAGRLTDRFRGDRRVTIARERVPRSEALAERAGQVDFVLCLNVLEHIDDDYEAVRAIRDALAPNGALGLLVPAHPRLYGALDRRFGHARRYSRERLADVVEAAGLEIEALYSFNVLGVLGWVANARRRAPSIDPLSLAVYELMLPPFRALERRRQPRFGLSLIVRARRRA